MNDFSFRFPTEVLFGNDIIRQIGEECQKRKARKAFLVSGKTATKKSPFLPIILDSLEQAGIEVQLYSEIEADPSIETVDRGVIEVQKFGADLILAFGGGSPMDAAKSIAMVANNGGFIEDYMRKRRSIRQPSITLICIPTTAGTGSEVTAGAVTSDKKSKEKIGVAHALMMPSLAIVDPKLHVSMPREVTAATGIDALTHAIEAYIANSAEPLSDALALHAIKLIGKYLRPAYANGNQLEARSQMALASLMAGAVFTNVGLGAVHGLAHSLGAKFGIVHGVANGIMLPYVMEACLVANYEKFSNIAEALGENVAAIPLRKAARKAVVAVVKLKQDIDIPHDLREIGLDEQVISMIVPDALAYRLLPNSPRKLTKADLERIVRQAL
ncbi:alcohol dehydrogenase [Sporomusaceae bacterium BoRhaA]|uniref:iron-containing alcohol dehydrogenase family protein n=1 Tax=Pelorhabdus rhamnosifermentans TaxID=2772457 RepID=UPI001C05FC73|nr:iron-containing alcohol dehydrogenase [Pelorhabdus rhamnosifermentans]MBU2703066.1 alcohol dehydrogenase [Pelorhabdus rhamnosifermentans]